MSEPKAINSWDFEAHTHDLYPHLHLHMESSVLPHCDCKTEEEKAEHIAMVRDYWERFGKQK